MALKAEADVAAWRASATAPAAALEPFRGPAGSVGIRLLAGTITFSRFSTVRAARWCPAGRRAYYEVEVVFAGDSPQWGFCTAEWPPRRSGGRGVGDEAGSWGVDGIRGCGWREGRRTKLDIGWAAGDVIGLACDPRAGEVRASVNGVWAGAAGLAMRVGRDVAGMLPALSCSGSRVRVNMGESPFRQPPPAGYEPVCLLGPPPAGGGDAAAAGDSDAGLEEDSGEAG